MKQFILLLVLIPISLFAQLRIKRIAFIPSGLFSTINGNIVCCDANHNGANELIFSTNEGNYRCWEIWEYRPINQYERVYVDTGWPVQGIPSLGIKTGNFYPFAAGYLDNDSAIDLVGMNKEKFPPESVPSIHPLTTVQEGPSPSSYPESLVWFDRLDQTFNVVSHYITDLDQDGRKEIFFEWYDGDRVYENIGNNQYVRVFTQPPSSWATYAFGDFDQDGRMEIAFPGGGPYFVYIRECIGDNQYPVVCSLPFPPGWNNPHDCWDGQDVDNDGKPEFFIAFAVGSTFYLYMWEATGNNTYERTFIDQKYTYVSYSTGRRSKCGDIDGDGIEEIVWTTPVKLFVYKATGNNQFQQIWEWNQDHGGSENLIVNIYDMNKNGYNEIVVGGSGKTSIFEVEAVQLLRPNGGETFHPDSQELIQWQTFHPPSADEVPPSARRSPPRCDSLSLFYSIDNGMNYTMITHGLSGNDTSYLWTVPNTNSDSCKIKIIAYGPGWQYDESDGTFRITTTGIEEIDSHSLTMTSMRVTPNPAKSSFTVRIPLSANRSYLKLFNISGKLVKEIALLKPETKVSLNDISTGIYFLLLETEEKRITERVIILK